MSNPNSKLASFITGAVPSVHWVNSRHEHDAMPLLELQQEVRALVTERDALVRSLREAGTVIASMEARIAQTFAPTAQRAADVDGERAANAILTAEVEALRADAERINFIEANPNKRLCFRKGYWSMQGLTSYEYPVFKTLREAIDFAMKEKK